MKRIVFVVALALVGFYGAWPAWTGLRIRSAIENQNAALLESKIDFPSVRTALKPAVTAEVERTIDRALKDAGPLGGLISGQIKGDIAGRIIESSINTIVTPENVIKIANDGRNLREAIERVMKEQVGLGGILGGGDGKGSGGFGGLGGILEKFGGRRPGGNPGGNQAGNPAGNEAQKAPADESKSTPAQTPAASPPAKRRFGIANLKSIRPTSLLSFAVGVARDPAASEPDVISEMRFTGFDWRVVAITPRLDPATQ